MKLPNFTRYPLIPVIIQDFKTLKVLMLGYMNVEAYNRTIEENYVYFYSRSRKSLWKKGEKSGHFQKVEKIFFDCDEDTLLIQVDQKGDATCHEGYVSCFYRLINNDNFEIVEPKVFDPKEVYKKRP
ncbi:MAG: phosphoribosyl-AMP cyclohydrolase [Spirochaetota bacterium]|nr:phosphoribosyl-AMP cyclohydrolase [Spirochaetota bacterium]